MAMLGSFLHKRRCQATHQDDTDDDYCYPIYQPCVPDIPLNTLLVQLRYKASLLLNQLADVETQIVQLEATVMSPLTCYLTHRLPYQFAAAVPSSGLGDSTRLFTAPHGLERSSISKPVAHPSIIRRKVVNKKVSLTTSGCKLVAKDTAHGKDGPVIRDPEDHLGRRSLDQWAEEGIDDSGSNSYSSDSDVCTVCGEEPTLHSCPSGCGSFCQLCYEAHLDDGRHWLT